MLHQRKDIQGRPIFVEPATGLQQALPKALVHNKFAYPPLVRLDSMLQKMAREACLKRPFAILLSAKCKASIFWRKLICPFLKLIASAECFRIHRSGFRLLATEF